MEADLGSGAGITGCSSSTSPLELDSTRDLDVRSYYPKPGEAEWGADPEYAADRC
jgi:hypothetical protein